MSNDFMPGCRQRERFSDSDSDFEINQNFMNQRKMILQNSGNFGQNNQNNN